MYSGKHLAIVVLMMITISTLICDVWDPALGIGNWRSSQYKLYISGTDPTTVPSPFYSNGVSHLNDINLGANADFKIEDGWRLYGVEFGDPGVTMPGYPVFGLYNEYLGLLRLFMYRPYVEGYTFIALKAYYDGNSTLFGLGEENCDSGIKALDKRDDLGECSFIRVFGDQTAAPCWYYIDLNLLYDPVQRTGQPSIYLKMYGATESSINCGVTLSGLVTSTNSSSSPDLISFGSKLFSTYQNSFKQGEQLQHNLEEFANPDNDFWDLNIPADIRSGLYSTAIFLSLVPTKNILPWISVASTIFSTMSGRSNNKVSNTSIELKGNITGSMTAQHNLVTTDFFESMTGERSLTPVYNKTMGLFQMNTTPSINHSRILHDGDVEAHTYQFATNPPALSLNPESGLTIRNSELECAIEFTFQEPLFYQGYFEEATGMSFDEMQEAGCYTKLREELIDYWWRRQTYRTPFVPINQIYHTAFTVPRTVIDARIVVKAIMDVNTDPNGDPVYQLISFSTNINDVANQNAIYPHISSQLVDVLYHDLTFPNANQPNTIINLDKSYSVEIGKTLRFQNCTVNLNSGNYGVLVKNGRLEFSNCNVYCSGGYFEANGTSSVISITNGSIIHFTSGNIQNIVSQGARIEIDNSSLVVTNGTIVSIADGSELAANNSSMTLNSSKLYLSGGSLVTIGEGSDFHTFGNSEIKGETSNYYYDPASSGNGAMYGAENVIPGDRIIVKNNSKIRLESGTSIIGTARWDGIRIENCINESDPSYIMANISSIDGLVVEHSNLEITNSQMTNCGQLQIADESDVLITSLNYHHNDYGIYVDLSTVNINTSQIKYNGSSGLYICYPGATPSSLSGVDIEHNLNSGIELRHIICNILPTTQGSHIIENGKYGYLNLSSSPSIIYANTSIGNNGSAEVVALWDCFPYFYSSSNLPLPYVFDSEYNPNTFDKYLLVAFCSHGWNIYVDDLNIDRTDENRFFPNFGSYVFYNQSPSQAEIMFSCAMDSIYVKNFVEAYDIIKTIIGQYPESQTAKQALPYLAYLDKAVHNNQEVLFEYLNTVNAIALKDAKLETKALLKLSRKQYVDAIQYFEQIILDPPSEEKALIAQLDEAYCYYKMVVGSSKNLPVGCHQKPRNFAEYTKICSDIETKLLEIYNNENEEVIIPLALDNNYPNPFNPSTTITLSLPKDMKACLDIYNIKGQKINTLANGVQTKGSHKLVWDGKDSNGNPVSAGVYFYKLTTPERTYTKKMLMLK